jgi:3-hydroxybutyryl-CoA dehydratase
MSGLFTRSPLGIGMQAHLLAMLSVEWAFKEPLRVGDTVYVEAEIVDRRPTSRPERGIVRIRRDLVNQDGTVIQTGETPMMVRRRPAAD